jgi:glycosyltransferase involved in cell wall biosynthesis
MTGLRERASGMASARRRLGLAQDRFIVLHAAGLAPRAGADTAILGLAMLRRRWGVDADLVVAHGDLRKEPAHQPQLARLRMAAADLGIAAQVRFAVPAGPAQMRGYYGAANVVASTPWYALECLTTALAMACARPVIGARVFGIEDMVVDGLTGYLIPPRDPELLARRLASLHRQPGLAEAMGQAGHRRLRAHRRQPHAEDEDEDMQARIGRPGGHRRPAWLPSGACE